MTDNTAATSSLRGEQPLRDIVTTPPVSAVRSGGFAGESAQLNIDPAKVMFQVCALREQIAGADDAPQPRRGWRRPWLSVRGQYTAIDGDLRPGRRSEFNRAVTLSNDSAGRANRRESDQDIPPCITLDAGAAPDSTTQSPPSGKTELSWRAEGVAN